MNPKTEKIMQYLTGGIFVLALGLTGYNLMQYPDQIRRLKRREQTLSQLSEIERQQSSREQILQLYEQYGSDKRQEPQEILSQADSGLQIVSSGIVAPLFDGWVVEELQIEAKDIMLEHLGPLFDALQGLQPPWAVNSCQLKAANKNPGHGDVALSIQSIYRGE